MTVDLRKSNLEDFGLTPPAFNNENDGYGKLYLVDMYGVLFPNGTSEKPIWIMRHANKDKYRFGGVFEPADDVLGLQKPLYLGEMAQKGTFVQPYQKLSEDCYGIGSVGPFSEYRVYDGYATYKEANIYDLKAEFFPKAIFKHADDSSIISHVTQPCLFTGLFEGKKVKGIGNFELCYAPQTETRELNDFAEYISVDMSGIRPDGKKEVVIIYMDLCGRGTGFYWLEGKEPIFSEHVTMDATWLRLPYMKDGTCVYKDAVWCFGGEEFHFNGKWGYKGLTAYPRIELGGQSQVMGTWYAGSTPYKHQISMTFMENMAVYVDKLENLGFEVD